ncbi:MAG: winged helix-turn-helix transcriptional regulator [Anaerolineae bacterium]|nr:winged helix-turn-helix transcriptional regulator [Anaerolineae bacterium]
MEPNPNTSRDLVLLEQIEHDPDVTQASLADHLGVAVGTVNWHLKRLISKGYVKVKRAQRKKLRYIITPQGVALRARLTVEYVERSFRLYRKTREHVRALMEEVRAAGYDEIRLSGKLDGENDIGDICRLTALEQGVHVVTHDGVPTIEVQGTKVLLHMEQKV